MSSELDASAHAPGGFLHATGLDHTVGKYNTNGDFLLEWGSVGSGDGQFVLGPYGSAVGTDGTIQVADYGNKRIQRFSSDGTFLEAWGTPGPGDGEFDFVPDVAIDSNDDIYTLELFADRVQKFSFSSLLLFTSRVSTGAEPVPPGAPVFFDSVEVSLSHALGDSFYITGTCGSTAPWIVDDGVFVNGVSAGIGFAGDKGLGLPLGVPVDSILLPVPARNITDLIPPGENTVEFKLADTQRAIYGNTDIYLLRFPSSIPSGVGGKSGVISQAPTMRSFPNPFNPNTTIEYRIWRSGAVSLRCVFR